MSLLGKRSSWMAVAGPALGAGSASVDIAPGTIVVWSDIACPWATMAVARLHRIRQEMALADRVRLDHRAFPLELFNEQPTPRVILDAEIPVVGAAEPGFGWSVWKGRPDTYPVSSLLALEAVQAAKEQSLGASEQLDLALRRAFFVDSRCITMRSEIVAAARTCTAVDAGALGAALDDGRARRIVVEQKEEAERGPVEGSPHLFAPGEAVAHNPGVRMHWEGAKPGGYPVLDHDDPSVYRTLLAAAAES